MKSENSMKPTKVIAIHTLKGGLGKTSLTIILASYLQYVNKKKVLIMDADDEQLNSFNQRATEFNLFKEFAKLYSENPVDLQQRLDAYLTKPTYAAALTRFLYNDRNQISAKDFYPIHQIPEVKAKELSFARNEYDYVFLDLGGRYNPNITGALSLCDVIAIPFMTQQLNLHTSIRYLQLVHNAALSGQLKPTVRLVGFWNKYSKWFSKIADATENRINAHFEKSPFFKGFLAERLIQADSGFDTNKMISTLSSPLLMKGGKYLERMPTFIDSFMAIVDNDEKK